MLEHHLEKLVTFVGVANAGSIRKFATSQHLSQPGVSQRVSALERQVGLPLLHRSRNGIELTRHGRAVYELGLRLIEQAQAVETELYRESRDVIEVRFGTYDSVAIYLMPRVVAALEKRVPHLRLKLECGRSEDIMRRVSDGELDLGLCMVRKVSRRLEVEHAYTDQYGFYVLPGPARGQVLITVVDSTDQDGRTLEWHIKALGLGSLHVLAAPSFEVAKGMVLAGLGIGILPNRVALTALKAGQLKRATVSQGLPASFGPHTFGIVKRKGSLASPEAKLLVEMIRAELQR